MRGYVTMNTLLFTSELADRQEARLYQMSGALHRVLEKANIGSIRKLEGTDRYEVSPVSYTHLF